MQQQADEARKRQLAETLCGLPTTLAALKATRPRKAVTASGRNESSAPSAGTSSRSANEARTDQQAETNRGLPTTLAAFQATERRKFITASGRNASSASSASVSSISTTPFSRSPSLRSVSDSDSDEDEDPVFEDARETLSSRSPAASAIRPAQLAIQARQAADRGVFDLSSNPLRR